MSSRARIGIVLAAAVVLVAAFLVAKGGGDDDNKDDAARATQTQAAPGPASATETGATAAAPAGTATATAPTAPPAIPTVTVVGGKPQGGIEKLSFTKGDTIRFRVKSDTADEIHFHGYDVAKDVEAGGSVTFSVPGKIEGRFVVELEGAGVQIAEVRVNPS